MISLLIALFLILGTPFAAHADTPGPDQALQVTITPENPAPGDTITISVVNDTYNLAKASISWLVNGSVAQKATGLTTFSTTLGPSGTRTDIKVNIQTIEGVDIIKDFPFNLGSVGLVWEANTYVPPWYKGKAIFTPQATGRVIALPQIYSGGVLVSPSNLIYDWTDNGSEEPTLSGYGKNIYYFVGNLIDRPRTIGVTVTAKSGTMTAQGQIEVDSQQPMLRIYENNPTYGLQYQAAIGNTYNLSVPEVSFQAVPFFYSATTAASSDLAYTWLSNGISTNQTTPFITFRNDGSSQGTSQISLEVTHAQNILQDVQEAFSVMFTQSSTQQKNAFSL